MADTPGLAERRAPLPRFLDGVLREPDKLYELLAEDPTVWWLCVRFLLAALALLGFYGAVMGSQGGMTQAASSLVKLPLLFLATLFIAGPSLYVFNLVLGSKLRPLPMLALVLFAIAMTAVMAASLAPVAWFFMASGSGYQFMVFLHVCILGLSGTAGLVAMHRGLSVLCEKAGGSATQSVFRAWVLLYAVVGSQMAWLMRPFVGNPGQPFGIFRPVESNFFVAVGKLLVSLLSGGYGGY